MPSKASIRNCATSLERMKTVKVTSFSSPLLQGTIPWRCLQQCQQQQMSGAQVSLIFGTILCSDVLWQQLWTAYLSSGLPPYTCANCSWNSNERKHRVPALLVAKSRIWDAAHGVGSWADPPQPFRIFPPFPAGSPGARNDAMPLWDGRWATGRL